ncbi:MAG: acetyl-CoA carboxylase biotin carboxylase subunit [Solirubrobacterales bacterium]|nr:acetyl-CoA carboxylase biotin carboxylase subunit [Solirubrobacterales bacterium]MBV9716449.1 acetyl-CoA carboxylase biotin carboxylase subunit [Solirubrobacterales bacterium]
MHRVLVANRGEIALRVIRACRELELETVAVYSSADETALHVRKADAAICIGKPAARQSYLNHDALIDAARRSGADAVHPGYGFLSENAEFARRCEAEGLVWVGPSAAAIEKMGDKAAARRLAEAAEVPVVPGTHGTVTPEQAVSAGVRIGYPVMIKAAGGGGGRGIRVAHGAEELEGGAQQAAREAEAAFGNRALYLERLIEAPRHVEVQVLADGHGNAIHLYERECSLQRRRQKLLEESPSPALEPSTRAAMAASAVRLAEAAGYVNAGTVEFLLDDAGGFYFIEMNTRIQVEHPVTEMITGVDLVKEQLVIAAGEPMTIAQADVSQRGAAIEFRITAENPDADFQPSPGRIDGLELPGGPGVRVDTALYDGYSVPPFYDSLVAKLIVWGRDRAEAIARGRRALEEFVIGGIHTTVPFHRRMLADDGFCRGEYHTDYLAMSA